MRWTWRKGQSREFHPCRHPLDPLSTPDPHTHPSTHLEMLFFSLSPGGPQSGRRSRGDRALRGGRGPSVP